MYCYAKKNRGEMTEYVSTLHKTVRIRTSNLSKALGIKIDSCSDFVG